MAGAAHHACDGRGLGKVGPFCSRALRRESARHRDALYFRPARAMAEEPGMPEEAGGDVSFVPRAGAPGDRRGNGTQGREACFSAGYADHGVMPEKRGMGTCPAFFGRTAEVRDQACMAARTARTLAAMSGAPTSSETRAQQRAPRAATSPILCSLMPPMATKGRLMLAATHSR